MLLAGGSVGFSCRVSCILENEYSTIQVKFASQRIHFRVAWMIETYRGKPICEAVFSLLLLHAAPRQR